MTCDVGQPRDFPFGEIRRLEMSPVYTELRKNEPVSRVRMPFGGVAWLVTRAADIKAAYADPRFSRAATLGQDIPRMVPTVDEDLSLLSMDPPDHTRLRKLVAKEFTAHRVAQLREKTQALVNGLLDQMTQRGAPADIMHDFAVPTSLTVICELLGVPVDDRPKFVAWTTAALSTELDQIESAMRSLLSYFGELAERRVDNPTDDLLGALVRARDEQGRLSTDELVKLGFVLLIGGFETVANSVSNAVYTLLTRPDQLALLRADPGLVPQAVEECLRYLPISTGTGIPRVALEDVELGGVLIRAGDTVFMDEPCANRDESVFDRADIFDITRSHNPHLAFGYGIHRCIGAELARMEMQVALSSLLARFPGLKLAVDADEVPWQKGHLTRAPLTLPVAW
ncbi:MAG TPA: cytochrome P450 [Amycolatopsis sp.]|nr:cytochrome P450 [Amycolatopsis sp.]